MMWRRGVAIGWLAVALAFGGAVGCSGNDPGQRTLPPEIVVDELNAESVELQPGASTGLQVALLEQEGLDAAGLSYEWSVDGEEWTVEGDGASATVTAPDAYGAETVVTVVVSGDGERSDEAEIAVETVVNQEPTIESLTAMPNPVDPGGTVTLKAAGDDGNGDALTFNWRAEGGWALSAETGTEVELTAPDKEGLGGDVSVTVDDGYGGTKSRTMTVRTMDNTAPSVRGMTADPPQVQPGGMTTVEVEATDPDGDELSYDWKVGAEWTVMGEGASVMVQAPDAYGVSTTVEVTVTDPRGESSTATVTLSTVQNDGPEIASLTAMPRTVDRQGTVGLEVQASDPNGDALTYTWQVDSAAWMLSTMGAKAEATAPDKSSESTGVTVTVEDADGKKAVASTVISTKANQAPGIASLTPTPARVAPKGTSTVTVQASDPEGDALTYTWQAPQGWAINGSGKTVKIVAPDKKDVSATVKVMVDDGAGGSATASTTISTQPNRPPAIGALTAKPQTLKPGANSTVKASASDADGDALTYTWSTPAGWTMSGSGSTIVVTAPNSYGASGAVELVVEDTSGATAQKAVVLTTTGNTAPTISKMTATPQTVALGGSSKVEVQASDPDGDQLSYKWTLPSGWSGSSSTSSITVTAPQSYGALGTVRVEVSDGGTSVSDGVAVTTRANRLPTIDGLSVNPNPVLQNGTATASATARDPLGDTLNYKWSLSNSDWKINGSGATVSIQAPDKGSSTTTLTLVVDDGFGGTATATRQVKTKACSGTTSNCDGNVGNGCEVDLASDDNNCGSCGNTCTGGTACSRSQCRSGVRYSERFNGGQRASAQCRRWRTFRSQLSGSFSSVTIKGSRNPNGVTCSNPSAATRLCRTLRSGGSTSVNCSGRNWRVGTCGGIELSAEGSICSCPSNAFIVRPCISNSNWGGAGTRTCGGPTQTLEVICQR